MREVWGVYFLRASMLARILPSLPLYTCTHLVIPTIPIDIMDNQAEAARHECT